MAFSFYASLKSIPREMREAATIYRFNWWQRFLQIELPFATIGLVWNSMMSVAGAWFFLMACEQFGNFRLPGLGSYLQAAADNGDTRSIVLGILTMVAVIVLIDQVVWRPVIAWAEKFKLEQVEINPETKAKLESAVKELFSQQDFHQVNMRCIAQKTGVGLNTIYMHYESKERLLFAFVNEWIQNLDNRLVEHLQGLEDVKEKIRKTIWVILDFYEKNPDIGIIVIMTVPFKTWMTDETFKQKDSVDAHH